MWARQDKIICEPEMSETSNNIDGSVSSATDAMTDHYDQAQVTEIVEKQIARLGVALEDGLLTCHVSDGIILQANRGASRLIEDRLVGRDIASVLGFSDALSLIQAAVESNITQEFMHNYKGTVDRQFRIRLTRLDEERVAVLVMDMTLQRNLDKVRRDFVANVSHELRSPLTSLAGFIETLLVSDIQDESTTKRFLNIMDEEAQRMSRLIDDLLSLSRVEVEEHIAPTEEIPLLKVIGAAIAAFESRGERRGITLQLEDLRDDKSQSPMILGETDEIIEVFHNLLENSIKYGFENSIVQVRLSATDDKWGVVEVINQGDGIAEKHIPRLTERFYRVDKARSRQMGGTGLGLAIVKHIISRHRGKLDIVSEVGKETNFTVSFPLL